MKKIKLSKEQIQKLAVGVLLSGLGIFAYYRYFFQPTLKSIKETKIKVEELAKRVEDLERKAKQIDKLRAEIAVAERNWEDLKSRLPDDRKIPEILQIVVRLARKYRMALATINPQNLTTADLYYEIPFSIDVSGSYHDVALFLGAVGNLERLFHARNMTISPRGPTPENPATSIGAQMTLVTYQYKGG